MKSLLRILVSGLVMSFMFMSVSAASGINAAEKTVLDNYRAGYRVAGKMVVPTAGEVTTAENLLNHDDVDLSAAEAVTVNKAIDDIYAVLAKEAVVDVTKLSQAGKEKILSIATETAWPLGFTFQYDSSKNIANVWSASGVIAYTDVTSASSMVKQTGFGVNGTVVGFGMMLALMGVAFVALKKQNA